MLPADILRQLTLILTPQHVLTDSKSLEEFGRDRTRNFTPRPFAIVFPKSVDEVRKIVKLCYDNDVAMVPSGGRTGYAAAAVAAQGEIVISLSRMDRILKIDIESASVEVEAGAILENVQKIVADQGLLFPLDFAARGSAQIGGCISTNAGGLKVLKYGMVRDLVMGLDIVIADGALLNLNSNLHKNNSGYDLKQYFVGAEGTLGIITRATLKIVPRPKRLQVALLAVRGFREIMEIMRIVRLAAVDLTAFEFFSSPCLEAVLSHRSGLRPPFKQQHPYYLVLEVDIGDNENLMLSLLEQLSDPDLINDATVSSGSNNFRELWCYREDISESISMKGRIHKNDIAVPISSMPSFLKDFENLITERYDHFDVLLFGHIGDGNIHVNILDRSNLSDFEFVRITDELDIAMCSLIKKYNGSVSAEHGIGLLKKKLLHLQRSPEELAIMKNIKLCFDPKNLFNPGKIVDL